MEYIITVGVRRAVCSCGEFSVDLIKEKSAEEKIKAHAEVHGAEPEVIVIVRNAWETVNL